MVLCQCPNHFSRPEADLEAARRATAEYGIEVERRPAHLDAVGGPQLREGALLRRRRAPGAQAVPPGLNKLRGAARRSGDLKPLLAAAILIVSGCAGLPRHVDKKHT